MAVALRLTRLGKNKQPFYRIVAVDSKKSRDGKYIELLGTYDVLKDLVILKEDLVIKWLKLGAQPSDTVKNLFSKKQIYSKINNSNNNNHKKE